MYNIHIAAGPSGCYWRSRLSHLQRRCHCKFLIQSVERCSQEGSLWHFGRRLIEIAFAFLQLLRTMVHFPPILGGVSNRLFSAWKRAWLDVRGSLQSLWEDSSELLLVTPLAFPDLALDRLGNIIALLLGGSGVDDLICWFTSAFWLASWTCCFNKCLVTGLCCWSLTAWMASW